MIANPVNLSSVGITGFGGGSLQFTAVAGSRTTSLQLGSVSAGTSATISIDVQSSVAGSWTITTGNLTQNGANPAGTAPATLNVIIPPDELSLAKQFVGNPAAPGGTSQLKYTLRNLNRDHSITDISFTDDLNSALSGLTAAGLPTAPCGAGSTLTGVSTLTLSGGSLGPGESCEFTVDLSVPGAAADGSYTSTTSAISGTKNGGAVTGSAVSASLFVKSVPQLSMAFIDSPVNQGGQTTLRCTLTNPSSVHAASAIQFKIPINEFIDGAVVSTLPAANSCGTGSTFTSQSNGND